ncbi:MAG: DUF839 domain-containing protein [Planctomycetes bacterium]|nr:DUF839 domain-containing protein [Planctomycetota bacterium]
MKSCSFAMTVLGTVICAAESTNAQTFPYFIPLTESVAVGTPNDPNELNRPWVTSGFQLHNLTNVNEAETSPGQSIVRVPGLDTVASMFDMSAVDPSGRYVFIPHETQFGAGLSRYNIARDFVEVLFRGDAQGANGNWANDYGALDPCTWTPHGTIVVAEEWSGQGRAFEVTNALRRAGQQSVVHLDKVPSVSHEGLRFGHDGTMYFVDENSSGSIYKFVPSHVGDLSVGQSFVLSVTAFAGDPAANASSADVRTGAATWVPMTDAAGNALTVADPFDFDNRGGRLAADELVGTPYNRPEDIEISWLGNGHEVIYFTATGEEALYAIDLNPNGTDAYVVLSAQEGVTPKNVGFYPTTATLSSPDNIAIDKDGNIYIVEDKPNGDNVGGDIWFVRDLDHDGVAESLDHFMSLGVDGAESTGMIWDPRDPNRFFISVQHPDSMGIAGGQGDALWSIKVHRVFGCNRADLAVPFGRFNARDAIVFFIAFFTGDLDRADLNNNYGLDYGDIREFKTLFQAGCR